MGDFTPPTKSADLERSGQRKEQIGSAAGENHPSRNNPKPRKGPPPAAETNIVHPAAPGTRAVVPGAGVVGAYANAYPKQTMPDPTQKVKGHRNPPERSREKKRAK